MQILYFIVEIGLLLFGAVTCFYIYLKKQSYRSVLVTSFFNYFLLCYISLVINFFLKYLTYLAFLRNNGIIVGTPYERYSHILSALYVFVAVGALYYFLRFCRYLVSESLKTFSWIRLHIPVAIVASTLIYVFYSKYLVRYNSDETAFKYFVLTGFLISTIEMYSGFVTAHQSFSLSNTKKKNTVFYFGLFYGTWNLIGFLYLIIFEDIQFFVFDYTVRFGIVLVMGNSFLKNYFSTRSTILLKDESIEKALSSYDLNDKQIAVIMHVLSGKTNKEIAWELETTERNVKYHMKTIFNKIGVTSRMELIHKLRI